MQFPKIFFKENDMNHYCFTPTIDNALSMAIARDIRADNVPIGASIAVRKAWRPGQTITISFLNGSVEQQDMYRTHAQEWLKYANLKFEITKSDGMIRIKFGNKGSWSNLGTDALGVSGKQTMEFGWLDRRVILHETGHMLGLDHSHKSRNFPYHFNRDAVIRDLSGPPNSWSPDM